MTAEELAELQVGCDRCNGGPIVGYADETGCDQCGHVPLCEECFGLHRAEVEYEKALDKYADEEEQGR